MNEYDESLCFPKFSWGSTWLPGQFTSSFDQLSPHCLVISSGNGILAATCLWLYPMHGEMSLEDPWSE